MSGKLVIRDDIHGNIELEGVYIELVQSDDFQRLKDIIQTGTSYLKYPEMVNENRFEHSVGSYSLMCKIIDNIEQKLSIQGIKVKEEEKEIAKIAILLHDIGHGAYSHTLEKITGYSHEQRSIDVIKDKDTEIHKILVENYGEEFTNKVVKFLEKVYQHKKKDKAFEDIEIDNGIVSLENLLASLISNNIDADRLDYLVRDSKKAGLKNLIDIDELIQSFEFVLDTDKIIVAIPEEKKLLVDMALLERARNYRDTYFCKESVVGDYVFEILLQELRNNKKEVPNDIDSTIRKFLTNSKANFTTKEYMKITETPINEALQKIMETTKNEKVKSLCDVKNMTDSYQILNTDKSEEYIRYLLSKAIPEISKDTKGIIYETRWIKPYKSNENENINIITSNGIEDYKDIEQNLINLEPFPKTTIAISKEILRLELGISKEEFKEKHESIVDEVISTVNKSKDEFELRYVLTNGILNGQDLKEKIEEKYEIIDSAKYLSQDVYYDNPKTYEFLENKKALRVREGTTFYKSKQTYNFKKTRATFKKYKKDIQSNFTIRKKEEEIGESTNLEDYKDFLEENEIKIENLQPVLDVNNLRYLYTINVNEVLIDISFNVAYYQNQIYEMIGNIATIEIKPRNNIVTNRLSILELKQYIEQQIPELAKFLSNTNVYEIGMLDTYEKYKKGYIISEDAQEYEQRNVQAAQKIKEISEKAKQGKDFAWLNEIPTIDIKDTDTIIE